MGSGKHGRRHGVAGDLSDPREKKAMQTAMQGGRAHVTHRGGRGRLGGASCSVGGAWGGRWPRQQQAAATGSARACVGERAEEGRGTGESEGGPGGCVASSGHRGDRQRGRRWPGRVPARSGLARASYCPRRKTTGMAAVVGWAATVEGQVSGLPGERQVVLLSLSISVSIYLFCSVLF